MRLTDSQVQKVDDQLQALQHPYKRLTAWELEFLTSVTDQFSRNQNLSERQVEVLNKIHEEKA